MNERLTKMTRLTKMILLVPLAILGILIFTAIGGGVVMLLWNWLAPALFGLRLITFWQAIGLLALCRILFGGFGLGGGSVKALSLKERQRGCHNSLPNRCFVLRAPPHRTFRRGTAARLPLRGRFLLCGHSIIRECAH